MMGVWILWCRSQGAAFLLEINGSPDSPNIPTELLFQVPNIGGLTVGLIYCHTRTSGGGNSYNVYCNKISPLFGTAPMKFSPKRKLVMAGKLFGERMDSRLRFHLKSLSTDVCECAMAWLKSWSDNKNPPHFLLIWETKSQTLIVSHPCRGWSH